ncbi:MAG: hypothetical protein LUE99_15065 [Bacteroides sp.]|nr:hypothetical protein [Bacteroides sp.]
MVGVEGCCSLIQLDVVGGGDGEPCSVGQPVVHVVERGVTALGQAEDAYLAVRIGYGLIGDAAIGARGALDLHDAQLQAAFLPQDVVRVALLTCCA